jgi:hypothetical protein
MRYNAGFLLTTAILLSFIAQGHYHERPQRYGPIIPHLKTLFHRFCEIRNNQKLSREEADEQIDQMIMEEATEQLSVSTHIGLYIVFLLFHREIYSGHITHSKLNEKNGTKTF